MAETPVWPAYQIGSHDSIFALGVVSLVGVNRRSALQLNSMAGAACRHRLPFGQRSKRLRTVV
jgi:hypothetical protein